jgi:hypothetical protein
MVGPLIAIGESDFRSMRESKAYFVDKSLAIADLVEMGEKVVLIPRPRRFGKTLFLNMCREFFDRKREDVEVLFEGLAIRIHADWDKHRGRYPVVMLTLKDVKALNWETARNSLYAKIQALFSEHLATIQHLDFELYDREVFDRFLCHKANEEDHRQFPMFLCKWLKQATGEGVIFLMDEYDTPIHAAWDAGYHEEMLDFLRSFLSSACKDNLYLHKAVLTGILRVAKESIFSGMNNLGVCGIDSRTLSTAFGFTESEVQALLKTKELTGRMDDVRHWYNGYRFGPERTVIYNPWSVLNFTSKPSDGLIPYWINSARNELIENLITDQGREIRQELDDLIHGEPITKLVEDSVSMRDIEARPELLWSLLYHSGYLRCDQTDLKDKERELRCPNEEVRQIYLGMVRRWFSRHLKNDHQIQIMAEALLAGDGRLFQRLFSKICSEVLSFHDMAGEPEKVYHALFLGLLIWLDPWFQIRSNRESGYARYDLALYPRKKDGHGWVIEFKRADAEWDESMSSMLDDAMSQMKTKNYAADIHAQGCADVSLVAIAFQGKDHLMRIEESEPS